MRLLVMIGMVVLVGCSSVREIGEVNGVRVVRVVTRDWLAPTSTTLLGWREGNPGEVEVLSSHGGAGLVPGVATGGGIAGGAALLRPGKSENNVSSSSVSASSSSAVVVGKKGHWGE